MRLAPFALLALCALPACAPYGYGYTETYSGAAYGAPAPAYADPYYAAPGYVASPPASGLLLFGSDRRYDRRNDDYRRDDYRRDGWRRDGGRDDRYDRQRRPDVSRPARAAAPPPPQPQRQAPPPAFVPPRGGGGGGVHDPSFNPANPGASGADR